MTNFFNKVKAMCSNASKQREITLAEAQVQKAQEKLNALKGNVANNKRQRNNDDVVIDVAICTNHSQVKAYMNKQDNMTDMISYMLTNKYDNVLIDVAKEMSIDVVSLKYNVTETTKRFLKRCSKGNVKELNDNEKSYFINHLIVLYATKHKVKEHNVVYKFGTRKAETLKSYSTFRFNCVKDINV